MARDLQSTIDAVWRIEAAKIIGAVARIVRETLEKIDPQYPAPKGWDPKTVKVV